MSTDVVPSRVLGALRLAELRPNLERVAFEALLSPAPLRTNVNYGAMVTGLVADCLGLNLLIEGNGRIGLCDDLQKEAVSPKVLRDVVLAEMASGTARYAEFTRLLSWLLILPASVMPLTTRQVLALSASQNPSSELFTLSDARWNGVTDWVRFLGFGWVQSVPGEALMPDPTEFFFSHFDALEIKNEEAFSLYELCSRLETKCPWMERGTVAVAVRKGLATPSELPAGMLTESASLALFRLEKRGVIKLETLSDAKYPLTLKWSDREETRSHFVRRSPGSTSKGDAA